MGLKLNLLARALGVAVLLSSALGADSAGFGVSGAILKAEALPGEEIRHQMVVTVAEEGSPLELAAEVVGFGQALDGGPFRLEPEDDACPHSAREFLRASPERFHIEPGSSEGLLLRARSLQMSGLAEDTPSSRSEPFPSAMDPSASPSPYTSRSI